MKLLEIIKDEKYSVKVSKTFDNAAREYVDALKKYEDLSLRQQLLSKAYFNTQSDRDKVKVIEQLKGHQKELQQAKKNLNKVEDKYNTALSKALEKNLTPNFKY